MINSKNKTKGFTLLEILLVVALIAILASILIFAINPGQRFAEARNAQRWVDINAIASSIYQYSVDNNGSLPTDIPEAADCDVTTYEICQTDTTCGAVELPELTASQKYLSSIPQDPGSEVYNLGDGAGYCVVKNGNGRITVCAPQAELGETISITK